MLLHIRVPALLWGVLTIAAATNSVAESSAIQSAEPVLKLFVQKVIAENPRVRAAQSALEASIANASAATQPLYNPELFLDIENSDAQTRAVGVGQTIDWSGKKKSRAKLAESERLAVEANFHNVQRKVVQELLQGLAQYQTGQRRMQFAETRVDLMAEFAVLTQKRFDAGDIDQVELDLAKLAETDAKINRATAATGLAESRALIRSLTSRLFEDSWPQLPEVMPDLPQLSNPESLVIALPEILAARHQVESMDALISLRVKERRPDPTISFTGGKEDDEKLIGLNLSIPLHIRNRYNNEVDVAIAMRNESQQLADDLMYRAHARLVSARERYELNQVVWKEWEVGQRSLSRQQAQLQKLWEAGELSSTDYLVQIGQSLDVQENALDLQESLWRAWFEWLAASGRIDKWIDLGEKS